MNFRCFKCGNTFGMPQGRERCMNRHDEEDREVVRRYNETNRLSYLWPIMRGRKDPYYKYVP